MDKRIYAVDVGGTSIKYGVFNQAGALIKDWSVTTDVGAGHEAILEGIAEVIKEDAQDLAHVFGVGLGFPGTVHDGIVIKAANLNWEQVDVKATLLKHLNNQVLIAVENDANLAALGEYTKNTVKSNALVMFTLGTGIGGGIVLDGKLWRGCHGLAAEVGHLDIGMFDFVCGCGKTSCFETVASATGIKRLATMYIDHKRFNTSIETVYSAKQIFDAAKTGDKLALHVIDKAALAIAKASRMMALVLNPETILIGGGVSEAGVFLIERIESHYHDLNTGIKIPLTFQAALLGNKAGLYGCFEVVKQNG